MEHTGDAIRRALDDLGCTQAELARAMQKAQSTIAGYLAVEDSTPRTLRAVADDLRHLLAATLQRIVIQDGEPVLPPEWR